MSGQTSAATDIPALLRTGGPLRASNDADDWTIAIRDAAMRDADGLALPERRQEAWRYTPVSFLERTGYSIADHKPFDALQPGDIEHLMLGGHLGPRLVFVNGHLAPTLSAGLGDSGGITIRSLSGAAGDIPAVLRDRLDTIGERRHLFAAMNGALMSDGALIHAAAGAISGEPIEILHVSVGLEDPAIMHPRHLILVDDDANSHVVERYCALGPATYFNNAVVEVALGRGARLVHERVQEESAQAQHLSDVHVRLAERSEYKQTQVALGGDWSRADVVVHLDGEGARAELDGLLLARDRQLNDVHLDVRHHAPGCTSREHFKGILDGKGKVVFDGRILVAQDAQLTDAELSNHNLMLSRSAEVDTKPQLEIYADDVKCSHGTTVGELDPQMLFYLRSRGIPMQRATQMLCRGFAEEVLEAMTYEPLSDRVAELLDGRLADEPGQE